MSYKVGDEIQVTEARTGKPVSCIVTKEVHQNGEQYLFIRRKDNKQFDFEKGKFNIWIKAYREDEDANK